jgi:hypothetical protein
MKYYSGLYAFTQYSDCNEDSSGICNRLNEFTGKEDEYLLESDDMPFDDYGIFETVLIGKNEIEMCASHKRAYLDMLHLHKFEDLTGLAETGIRNMHVIHGIFELVSGFKLTKDKEVVRFMDSEFGANYRSYLVANGDDDSLAIILEDKT